MAFTRYRALPQGEMTPGEFRAWLSQFDADGDGRISKEELRHALHSLHQWFARWKARAAVEEADANRNGVVDAEEISGLFGFAQKHLHMKIRELDAY